jgi:hypothetical protein
LSVNVATQNTAIGANALAGNTSGNFNSVLGNNVLSANTTGSNNIGIGSLAGNNGGISNNSIFLGVDTKAAGTGQTNQIVIGYDATGLGSNTAVLGNASITTTALRGNVGIGTTAPGAPLEIRATAGSSNRESLIKCIVSDAGNDAFHVYNATSGDGRFIPGFTGSVFPSSGSFGTASCHFLTGQTDSANDTGTTPLVVLSARITSNQTDPNNGTLSAVVTRPLFAWWNLSTSLMQLNANGNLGIGTTAPSSKLQVSAGDVEVDTIAKGVILKSPDGTRYRVTVANGGTLSVAAV